jgi:hypothetical protein
MHRLANGLIADLPLLKRRAGITDVQTIPFYPQFDEEYPGSKFIYTDRDVEDWIFSIKHKMCKFDEVPMQKELTGRIRRQYIRTAVFGTIQFNESVFRRRYHTHKLAVLDYFKDKDNLLIMDICEGDGWEKLCPFLEKEVPDVEFPFANVRPVEYKEAEARLRNE